MSNVFRFKQFDIRQDHAAQKVGTDSDLLGALAAGGNDILDVGAGTGVLSLMMAQRFPEARITAVEIDDNAMIDLKENVEASPFKERISIIHGDFARISLEEGAFDSIVCNPPYFDLSLECPDKSRTRARHSSSLPFEDLIGGAYKLLKENGVFSVCIPPEVETKFDSICRIEGFWLQEIYKIKSVPEKSAKRLIIIYRKGRVETPQEHIACMRDAINPETRERAVSQWYRDLMKDYLIAHNS